MTRAQQLAWLRRELDWSQHHMARELGLMGRRDNVANAVHEMETGRRPITGPVGKLLEHIARQHALVLPPLEDLDPNKHLCSTKERP